MEYQNISGLKRIAILGGGPSGLFAYKRLIESGKTNFTITIFEKKTVLGAGMPYSVEGANVEHVTNVSDNEIPIIVTSINDWIQTAPAELLERFDIDPDKFNEYKVLPRLFFGEFLSAQFSILQQQAANLGISTTVHLETTVLDVIDQPATNSTEVITDNDTFTFDYVIISTGHKWPARHEGKIPGYFDSPYPPAKLALQIDHEVAVKGSSLTAVDAVRTLARFNGKFVKDKDDNLTYELNEQSEGFKIVMHTRNGMLPAVRFHLQDTHLRNKSLLTEEEIASHIAGNRGFLSLDFIFDKDFKQPIKENDPVFYERIKNLNVEGFVAEMMELRERMDPFQLLQAEYAEAAKSIKRKQSVYWKEMLGVLSFALNYPAKHLSAEDMLRLKKSLLPLIAIVIAYMPQSSSEEFMAMHNAGLLDIVTVGEDSEVIPQPKGGIIYSYTDNDGNKQDKYFKTYIDCTGQPHISYTDFPFKGLLEQGAVSPARLAFWSQEKGKEATLADGPSIEEQDGKYFLKVSGIAINDNFQIIDSEGQANQRIYIMAVPYIGGFNPDYSGLDFCEEASAHIIETILSQ